MNRTNIMCLLMQFAAVGVAAGQSSIDPAHQFAWSPSLGWTNWRGDAATPGSGVTVNDTYLSGYVWLESAEWLNLGDGSPGAMCSAQPCYANVDGGDFGVNVNPATGDLSGYAWGSSIGWVNFAGGALASPPNAARVDLSSCRLRGFVWAASAGWINLDDATHYVGLTTATCCTPPYFVQLGGLPTGNNTSYAYGLSADGSTAVGWGPATPNVQAFRWSCGAGLVALGVANGGHSRAWDVSGDGSVLAGDGCVDGGLRWTAGSGFECLNGPPSTTEVWGISNDGLVIVGTVDPDGGPGYTPQAFRWTQATGVVALGGNATTAFAASADGSVIVGFRAVTLPAGGIEAFRWTQATGVVGLGQLPGVIGNYYNTRAHGVSADGTTVVGYGTRTPGAFPHAFVWKAGVGMVDLGGPSTQATDASADGKIIVGYGHDNDLAHSSHIWTWDGQDPATLRHGDLRDMLINEFGLDMTAFNTYQIEAVSDDGLTFAGTGLFETGGDPALEYRAWVARVPYLPVFPLVTRGCCLPDGSCAELASDVCTAQAGSVHGTTGSCEAITCPLPCKTIAQAEALPVGTAVKLCNVVVSSEYDLVSASTTKSFQVQDATGGVTVFGTNAVINPLLAQFVEGDQIDIEGTTGTSNGLFQLLNNAGVKSLAVIANDGPVGVPTPDAIDAADLADASPTAEFHESRLARLNCATFTVGGNFANNTNYTVNTTNGTAVVRILTNQPPAEPTLVGKPIPTGQVSITGLVSQNDTTNPRDGNYQLLPRTLADLIGGCSTYYHGLAVDSLGLATLAVQSGTLVVSNIGASGQDGVAIDVGSATSVTVPFTPTGAAAGSVVTFATTGVVNGVPDTPLGSTTMTLSSPTAGTLSADFAPLGATGVTVRVYNGAALLREETGVPMPAAGSFSGALPASFAVSVQEPDVAEFAVGWDVLILFTTPGGIGVTGDRVVYRPEFGGGGQSAAGAPTGGLPELGDGTWTAGEGTGGTRTAGGGLLGAPPGPPDLGRINEVRLTAANLTSVTLDPLTVFPRVPDFDHDTDVDSLDVTAFRNCATRSNVPISQACQEKDLDGDGDGDMNDFAILQRCYKGNGVPADPNCPG